MIYNNVNKQVRVLWDSEMYGRWNRADGSVLRCMKLNIITVSLLSSMTLKFRINWWHQWSFQIWRVYTDGISRYKASILPKHPMGLDEGMSYRELIMNSWNTVLLGPWCNTRVFHCHLDPDRSCARPTLHLGTWQQEIDFTEAPSTSFGNRTLNPATEFLRSNVSR